MGGAALAIVLRAGPIEVVGEGGFTPTTLPKHETAPITLHGEGQIGTTDGSLPPILKTLTVWFDKHGAVVTKGLPVLHQRQAGGDHHGDRAQGLRRLDRRRGPRHRPDRLPRTEAVQGELADHDLQRAARTTATRPCSPTPTSASRRRPPTSSRSKSRRSTPARSASAPKPTIPKIAGGYGIPLEGEPDDRQKMDLQGQAAELRERQLPERQAAGESRNRIHRRDQTERDHSQTLQGLGLRRRDRTSSRRCALIAALACAAVAAAITTQIGNLKVSRDRRIPAARVPRPRHPARHLRQHRPDQERRRRPAAGAEDADLRIRQTRQAQLQGGADLHGGEAGRDDPDEARKRCAGALLGTGTGKARVDMPGKAAVHDQLADLDLQRAAGRRQADPDRPRLRDGALAAGAAGPVHDRKDQPRPLRLPDRNRAAADRRRRRAPRSSPKPPSAAPTSATATRSATPKPNAPAAGSRSTAS